MKVRDITQFLESLAPLHLQEDYDNSGLIVGRPDQDVKAALLCLDATPEVIDEALRLDYNMIIAHHPIVFQGLKRFNGKNYIEQTVIKAIRNDLILYAIHTNLDNVYEHGVNAKIADKLGLKESRILLPKSPDHPDVGAGLIGMLPDAMPAMDFLSHLKEKMNVSVIRHTPLVRDAIQKVALCGGSGSFLLERAIRLESDIFISADFKYHQFFDANGQIVIADIGHFESEQFTIELLQEQLNKKFSNFAAHCTNIITNPINYF